MGRLYLRPRSNRRRARHRNSRGLEETAHGDEPTATPSTRAAVFAIHRGHEVTYVLRGQKVNKLLDHESVIVLDIPRLPDVQEGEEVNIIQLDAGHPSGWREP